MSCEQPIKLESVANYTINKKNITLMSFAFSKEKKTSMYKTVIQEFYLGNRPLQLSRLYRVHNLYINGILVVFEEHVLHCKYCTNLKTIQLKCSLLCVSL